MSREAINYLLENNVVTNMEACDMRLDEMDRLMKTIGDKKVGRRIKINYDHPFFALRKIWGIS